MEQPKPQQPSMAAQPQQPKKAAPAAPIAPTAPAPQQPYMAAPTVPAQAQPAQLQAVQRTVAQYMSDPDIMKRFEAILGDNTASFCQTVILVSRNKQLAKCNPKSVMSAAMVAAVLDMPIDPNLGFAHIVPFKDEAQFQLGWRGFYQLAMNSGMYAKITTNEVYEGEIEVKNRFTEEFDFHPAKSKKVVGYIAYYRMLNGAEKYFYMTVDEIKQHAIKYSQSYRSDKTGTSQWAQNFDAMAKKTVLKLLLSKYGKLSIKMQIAQRFDQSVSTNAYNCSFEDIQEADVTYIDNQPEQPSEADVIQAISRQDAMASASEQFSKQTPTVNK